MSAGPAILACAPSTGWTWQSSPAAGGVLGQSPIAHLAMAKLALDHAKREFDFGSVDGLELLQLLLECIDRFAFVHGLALAGRHGNMPIHVEVLGLHYFTLVNAPVAQVGKDHFFLAMHQCRRLGNVLGIGHCGDGRVHQARVSVHADERVHATKCHWLPLLVWCISESHSRLSFLV